MRTTENNKLIAEFMNVDQVDIDTAIDEYGKLKYHLSWDWLMPVVRKIVEICCAEDDEIGAFESDQYTSILETVPLGIIEDAYKVVVEFIKWYNENKED